MTSVRRNRYAGAVIVNKEDLVDTAAKNYVKEAIKKVNPAAPVYFMSVPAPSVIENSLSELK